MKGEGNGGRGRGVKSRRVGEDMYGEEVWRGVGGARGVVRMRCGVHWWKVRRVQGGCRRGGKGASYITCWMGGTGRGGAFQQASRRGDTIAEPPKAATYECIYVYVSMSVVHCLTHSTRKRMDVGSICKPGELLNISLNFNDPLHTVVKMMQKTGRRIF